MFRRHRVAVLTIFTAILLFGPLQLADGAPRKTGVQKETAAKSDSGAKGQEAEPSKSGRNKPPAKDSFWDRFVNLVKPERAPRRREPEVTNDEQIVFNIGGATGARARWKPW
ncbi:MAG: hypothetical protein HC888_07665 [Candidatus Competibacteraceae bacterium]|nr:hypothetical protein [Candidatus Competibacteraceae bacterium]